MTHQTSNKTPSKHPPVMHSDYARWSPIWEALRAAIEGQRAIKEAGNKFLPKMEGQNDAEYDAYLARATFYNMVGQTRSGLAGTIFKKKPKIYGLSPKLLKLTNSITKDGLSLTQLIKNVCDEILGVGRHGVLLDMDTAGKREPYFTRYDAEDIIDWDEQEIDGRLEVSEIILQEHVYKRKKFGEQKKCLREYRVLRLENNGTDANPRWEYEQHIYASTDDADGDLTSEPTEVIVPTNREKRFNHIPFKFFGPYTNLSKVERPALVDILDLNISHYQSYAQLEHGRHYTALPIYYATEAQNEKDSAGAATFVIGPNNVWMVGAGEKPGLLEYHGTGLRSLEVACATKEVQANALGGRMAGVSSRNVSESDNQSKLREMHEQSLLLNVVLTVDLGMTQLMRWWAEWQDVKNSDDIRVEVNTDFLFNELGARELRAFHALYKDGIIPIDVLYAYLVKAELIPDEMDLEEFKSLLKKADQFPNQADVLARMRGFPDAKSEQAD
ncbi:MAG: DUF4055 domain-containing protein, partial [Robiginitomaculum sp.]|nr:DUF4055 domain-containing protein [Robiginitomaculum sp.]